MAKKRKRKKTQGIPKPKPTKYKGTKFKSVLEARWAVLLDTAVAVSDWKYEPTTVTDPNTLWTYTPDFLIVVSGVMYYLEIKPTPPTKEYLTSVLTFTRKLDHPVVMCIGTLWHKDPQPELLYLDGREVEKVSQSALFGNGTTAYREACQHRFDLPPKKDKASAAELQSHISKWVREERRSGKKK